MSKNLINTNTTKHIAEHLGHFIYFSHISYNCPTLGLWGYKTERQVKNAIARKIGKTK